MREDLAADLGEFGIGCKIREVDLDAHDLIHVGVELAQGLADAIEGDAHFLLEADGLVVRLDRHAHLTRDEYPAAGFGIDAQRLAEALRDRAGEMSHCAHDGTLSCERSRWWRPFLLDCRAQGPLSRGRERRHERPPAAAPGRGRPQPDVVCPYR